MFHSELKAITIWNWMYHTPSPPLFPGIPILFAGINIIQSSSLET